LSVLAPFSLRFILLPGYTLLSLLTMPPLVSPRFSYFFRIPVLFFTLLAI
jgi:hypothetical protein